MKKNPNWLIYLLLTIIAVVAFCIFVLSVNTHIRAVKTGNEIDRLYNDLYNHPVYFDDSDTTDSK